MLTNRFEVLQQIGSTGASAILRARDRWSGELVALKILRDASPVDRERFANEAALLAGFSHPAIVRYVDHGTQPGGEPYLAMAWVEGPTLRDRLARGALAADETVAIIGCIAGALGAAHARGVIHRDIKPANVVLPSGLATEAVLVDFGIARRAHDPHGLTRTGVAVGTPGYMSPEQTRATRQIEPASDVFGLGCLAYACLAGRPPFAAEHVMALRLRVLFSRPEPLAALAPVAPPALVALVERMLCKRIADRPPDGAAVEVALASLGGGGRPCACDRTDDILLELAGAVVILAAPDDDGSRDLAEGLATDLAPIVMADGAIVVPIGRDDAAARRAAEIALAMRARSPRIPILIARMPEGQDLDRLVGALVASSLRGAVTGVAPICVDASVERAISPAYAVEVVDRLRVLRGEIGASA